jgi:hypothetical protein
MEKKLLYLISEATYAIYSMFSSFSRLYVQLCVVQHWQKDQKICFGKKIINEPKMILHATTNDFFINCDARKMVWKMVSLLRVPLDFTATHKEICSPRTPLSSNEDQLTFANIFASFLTRQDIKLASFFL